MKKSELTDRAALLTDLQRLADYLVPTNALADAPESTCRCVLGTGGRWVLAGPCVAETTRPAYCRAVSHHATRIWLLQHQLPHEHLSDRQLDHVVPELAELARRAPDLTTRRFVIELQSHLRASLAPLATPVDASSATGGRS